MNKVWILANKRWVWILSNKINFNLISKIKKLSVMYTEVKGNFYDIYVDNSFHQSCRELKTVKTV